MTQFNGKTILITGGTTGIGFSTAKLFIEAGAKVIISGQDTQRLDEAVKQLGEKASGIRADISSISDIQALFKTIKKQFGQLDSIFVNAGVAWFTPLLEVDEAHFDKQMDVNFKGAFFTIQSAVPLMKQGGTIIVNTSIFNKIGTGGASVYSASKAALRSLVRTLGAELVTQGIRINAVSPGPVETPIYSKLGLPSEQLNQMTNSIQGNVAMGRFGQPDEIGKVVLFLAGEESSFMLGEELVVDGGWTAI
jgi:NAD(P)-dependent dehydrogenase (short-subunit alcohol dehydrogenase family)